MSEDDAAGCGFIVALIILVVAAVVAIMNDEENRKTQAAQIADALIKNADLSEEYRAAADKYFYIQLTLYEKDSIHYPLVSSQGTTTIKDKQSHCDCLTKFKDYYENCDAWRHIGELKNREAKCASVGSALSFEFPEWLAALLSIVLIFHIAHLIFMPKKK